MKLTGISLLFAPLLAVAIITGCSSSSSTNNNNDGSGVTGSGGGAGGAAGKTGSGGASGSGAGGASGAGMITSCTVPSSNYCIEYSADYTGSRQAGCTGLQGTYATAPCDHAGSSGGCRQPAGAVGTQTTYYYAPIMPADVMVQCTNDGNATYVPPGA